MEARLGLQVTFVNSADDDGLHWNRIRCIFLELGCFFSCIRMMNTTKFVSSLSSADMVCVQSVL